MAIERRSHHVTDFLNHYAAAIGVTIVDGGDYANPDALLEATLACREHLFLDPDTGLGERTQKNHLTHVDYDQFIQIVQAQNRRDRLTLIYDEGNSRDGNMDRFTQAIQRKVNRLHQNEDVHVVGYLAELAIKVCFIWASTNPGVVTGRHPEFTGRIRVSQLAFCRRRMRARKMIRSRS